MLLKKDTKFIFGTKGAFSIAEAIFNYPHRSFHIRELTKTSSCSTTAIVDGANILENYKIIKIEENNITKNIKADLDSDAYYHYKLIFNLYRLMRYSIVDNLKDYFNNPECIVVFGSFAKGEDVENSDIDILIISSSEKPKSKNFDDFINIFRKEFNRDINIIVLKSLEKAVDSFKNSISNGIVLHGYLKVI